MPVPPSCPGVERWQALLDDAVPADQREECERHLESCRACQERLPGAGGWHRLAWAVAAAVALTALALLGPFPAANEPAPAPEAPREFYQDFRESRRPHPALNLYGPDVDAVSRPEAEGLRITLPATRPVNQPIEIATRFAVGGDFEITGTYQLLAADRPAKGYGVGVSVNVAESEARHKFAKVARALLANAGSVFQSEYWTDEPRRDYQVRTRPTGSRLGRLRLVRTGAAVRFLAADGLDGDFQEIYSKDPFGTEDMVHVHFVVADSGTPGNAVDARLVDLRIRAARLLPDPTAQPTPAAAAEPASVMKGWFAAGALLVVAVVALAAAGLALRRRTRQPSAAVPAADGEARPEAAAASVAVRCPGCGKVLKARRELAGKRIKCPQCGQPVPVSLPGATEAGGAPS
jgi:hypothetical protein